MKYLTIFLFLFCLNIAQAQDTFYANSFRVLLCKDLKANRWQLTHHGDTEKVFKISSRAVRVKTGNWTFVYRITETLHSTPDELLVLIKDDSTISRSAFHYLKRIPEVRFLYKTNTGKIWLIQYFNKNPDA